MDRLRRIPSMLKRTVIELNLFKSEVIDNNEQSQIHYQRMATRLYIVLVALGLIIFTLYLFLTPQRQVEIVENPSPANFSDLQSRYNSSLLCTCSNISVPYNVFLSIEPHYHYMCSSVVTSESWVDSLTVNFAFSASLIGAGSGSNELNFMFNGGSQFLLLKVLCNQSNQMINNSLGEFLNQTFVATQVISEDLFELQANALIEDWKTATIKSFLRTFDLIRAIQHGNHLAGAKSNSQFSIEKMSNKPLLNSMVYDNQCNCMLSKSCHSPMGAFFYGSSFPQFLFEITGLFMGCFRLEALLNSTLECFYNQTCTDKVNDKGRGPVPYPKFTALNATRNSPNESIDSIARQLFVEKWSNYSSFNSYYTACAPRSCTYEYMHRRKLVSLIPSIIGMFGGLTTGLEIIFLVLLRLIAKVRLFVITFSC
jgi:hypothetical protein